MTTIAPAYLAPDWRYAGNDWQGQNALKYVVQTPAVYAADGITITTPGVPIDITGYTVLGRLRYQPQCAGVRASGTVAPLLPVPVGAIVDPQNGVISLSLARDATTFPRQSLSLWPNPAAALLIIEPQVMDLDGNLVTIGLQQLFVI